MKKLSAFLFGITFFLSFPQEAFAQVCPPGPFANLCKIKLENGGGIVGAIVTWIIVIAILASVIFFILGGIKWITSGGDEAKVKAARSTLIAAIVGLVISLSAFFIVNIVLGMFLGQGLSSLKVPKLVN
jgi:hypothetical protein